MELRHQAQALRVTANVISLRALTKVVAALSALPSVAVRYNLADVRSQIVRVGPGSCELESGGTRYFLDDTTTIWWHRAGTVDIADLDVEERKLAIDEGPHVLRGMLLGTGCRFVDDPFQIACAELKLVQLATASRLNISIPETVVTNDVLTVIAASAGREVVAKPLSPGIGITPHVDKLRAEDVAHAEAFPTLIQSFVEAGADLRVVVVGSEAWVWRRQRSKETIDWRAEDPSGQQFHIIDDRSVAALAVRLTSALGLTTSVQDWLDGPRGPVFLEANPQGGWLFLGGAEDSVLPALVRHLTDAHRSTPGKWPSPLRRLMWDFAPAGRAPANDGAAAPTFRAPVWLDQVAASPHALDVARRAHEDARGAADVAEQKAHRFAQIALPLIAIALTLATYQLSLAVNRSGLWWLTLAPTILALGFLTLAAYDALQVDRVGFYRCPEPADLAFAGNRSHDSLLLGVEEEGRRLARWSAKNKHSELMQARSWFSRGLSSLIVAGIVAAISSAFPHSAVSSPTVAPSPSHARPPSPSALSTATPIVRTTAATRPSPRPVAP